MPQPHAQSQSLFDTGSASPGCQYRATGRCLFANRIKSLSAATFNVHELFNCCVCLPKKSNTEPACERTHAHARTHARTHPPTPTPTPTPASSRVFSGPCLTDKLRINVVQFWTPLKPFVHKGQEKTRGLRKRVAGQQKGSSCEVLWGFNAFMCN